MADKIKMARRTTKAVPVGNVTLGGNGPVIVQSMTNVPTHDLDRTLEQIDQMIEAGCEMVRLAVPTARDTAVLGEIVRQVPIPVIADVHFHYARALEAIQAGVSKIRLNPGNIKDRKQVEEVIAAAREHGTAIRVGVNQGSIRVRDKQHTRAGEDDIEVLMVEKLREYVRIFQDNDFHNLVLSAKCHDAAHGIAVNRTISEQFDYPLHLGVTHAGTIETGSIRSAVGLGTLLAEGIGDTIRVSLAGDPAVEIGVAWEILNTLALRPRRGPELIACPTCGRTEIALLEMTEQVSRALAGIKEPLTVAVMGCVVNGPGEAADADVALCGGRDKAVIYRSGRKVATVASSQAVESLLEQVKIFIDNRMPHGQ